MNRLTPIFIAGALAVSAGLAIAQNQMTEGADPIAGHGMDHGMGHDMGDMAATDSPSTKPIPRPWIKCTRT